MDKGKINKVERESPKGRRTAFDSGKTLLISEARWAELRALSEKSRIALPTLPAGLKLPRRMKSG